MKKRFIDKLFIFMLFSTLGIISISDAAHADGIASDSLFKRIASCSNNAEGGSRLGFQIFREVGDFAFKRVMVVSDLGGDVFAFFLNVTLDSTSRTLSNIPTDETDTYRFKLVQDADQPSATLTISDQGKTATAVCALE